ncbi:UNVERIFIED_CONTAM: hypothetical protein GTU68_050192, partial [Idotea baltica]|nr:hypothetical protein [Idotea baltica]
MGIYLERGTADTKYQFRLSEDTPLYTSVAKVKAEDPDNGLNGQVYYSFQNPTSVFAIHPTSGVVSLTRPLSQPDQPRYELTVVARDRGLQLPGSWPSTASLVINVTVVNVFEPTIKISKLTEYISNGHLIVMAIINVHDSDRGPSGEVKSLEIIEGDPDRVFRIIKGSTPSEFNLAALHTLKWDEAPYGFNLSLKVTDNGARPRFSYKPVRISPPQMRLQEPIFLKEEYNVEISEMAPPGSKIVGISTWLPGTQSRIAFSIVAGNEGGHFKLDRRSGVLFTNLNLDADSQETYSLTVAATSSGMFRANHQNSAKVIVKVIDANDYTPMIVAPQGTVTVEEHQNQGSWVTQVRAQDYDSGENKRVSYSLANADEVPFIIDHFSGEIRTSETLDYETGKRVWKLKVRASDWGTPFRRQSEKTIVVRVIDINDNRPQFEHTECTGYIDKATPLGSEIFTLSALDFDEGNIISYRILDGNEDRCFVLDSTSGVLTLTCDLSDLDSSERFLNVTATDGQHFADTMTIRLQLLSQRSSYGPWAGLDCRPMGIARKLEEQISQASKNNPKEEDINFSLMTPAPPPNEHAPDVFVSRVDVRVRENSDVGTVVHQIKAQDPDSGYDGHLTYAITDGNEDSVFDIGMSSGEISVAGLLDRERVSRYTMNVSVFDSGQVRRSASQIVTVTLVDENDNPPKFDKAAYSFFLPENVGNGTSVYQLLAYDPDEGLNGVISYHLETDTEDFHLDPVAGRLSVARPLDYESHDVYELRVVATDGGGRSSYAYVTVELADINDCPPEFPEGGSFGVRVPEDLPVGALVTLVTARDPDSSNLRYFLDGGHDDSFELDASTAVLRLTKPLDYEAKPVYNISVRATDDGIPPLSSQTYVIIQVIDVNENVHAPVFGQDVLEASVSEGAPPHSLVASAPARDGDLNLNPSDAAVSYSLVGAEGIGLFYIDQKGN